MSAVQYFTDSQSYEAFIEQQRKDSLARHAAQRLAQLAEERARRSLPRPRVMPSSEETCRRIADIVSRRDVRRLEEHAKRFARTVCVFRGGGPGLGAR